MPQDAAPTVSAPSLAEAPDFPADTRAIHVSAPEFAAGGLRVSRFHLVNPGDSVLHVRLQTGAPWLLVAPGEVALGPGEQQVVAARTDVEAARDSVRQGGAPSAGIRLSYQRLLRPDLSEPGGTTAAATSEGSVYVHLPIATCPSCHRSLDSTIADGVVQQIPDICPFCFERLRSCPVCGAPNSWLARRCVADNSHIVRASADWVTLGGGAAHEGSRDDRVPAALGRRWSYPSVPPARRENALAWSAPATAYGLVTAAAATSEGDAHLYAFDARTGAPMWDPFPLPDPVYPDRGGATLDNGRIYVATVEGVCVCVDALRGTRLWETRLPGRVFGALIPDNRGWILAPVATREGGGCLLCMDGTSGQILWQSALNGPPDSAPAYADGRAFVHDDCGTLTALEGVKGERLWSAQAGAGFDAAPVVREGGVFSATIAGVAFRHDAATGREIWRHEVTNAPIAGTPACDAHLLYLPSDDGLHLLSADAGRPVRRYPTRQPVRSTPVVADGTLFFAATDGNVYGASSGKNLEKLYETGTIGSQIVAATAFSDGALFAAATNGVLYGLSVVNEGDARVGR